MPTGDKYLNIVSKRVLGIDDFGTRFLEYMRGRVEEVNRQQYETAFFHPNGVLANSAATNQFTLAQDTVGGNAIASDGLGNFLDFENSNYQNIQFENTLSINYYIALKHCTVPNGLQINPRTGNPEWISHEDQIGEKEDPDLVTDNGNGTITFVVDSVTETGVDNTGRLVTVYKKNPASGATTEAIAKEELVVFYSGGLNQITTSDDLGQATISTLVTDYEVILKGPTVKRYTDLRTVSGYCYIGYLTGTGGLPTTFDRTDQKIIPHSWTELLVNGIEQDFFPATDNTYKLGTSTKRWSDIYTNNLSVSSHFLPLVDNTQDIGSWSLMWKDGLFGGLVLCTDLEIDGASLGDGLQTDLMPATDYNSWLGSSSYSYAGIYSHETHFDMLEVEQGSASQGVNSHLRPTATNTWDLGGGGYTWDSITGRRVNVDGTLSVNWAPGTGVTTDFVPDANNMLNLGFSSYQWDELHVGNDAFVGDLEITRGIQIGRNIQLNYTIPVPQPGVSSDWRPNADDTYDLGSSSYQWAQVRAGDLSLISTAGRGLLSSVTPATHDTYSLGAAAYEWANIYTTILTLSAGAGDGVGSNIMPITDDTYDIGSISYRWQDMFLDGVANIHSISLGSGSSTLGFTSDCTPNLDDTRDLGDTSYRWQDLYVDGTGYIDKLVLNTAVGDGVGSDVLPSANDTYDLGSTTYYWSNVYADNLLYKTSSTTFDDEDDLALVDKYVPTDKTITLRKKGIDRVIRKANPDSIPWPMLGNKDPVNGDYFLHAGDSVTFLLGALKQMHEKHKEAVKRIEKLEKKQLS